MSLFDAITDEANAVLDELRAGFGAAWEEPSRLTVETTSKIRCGSAITHVVLTVCWESGRVIVIERDYGSESRRLRSVA